MEHPYQQFQVQAQGQVMNEGLCIFGRVFMKKMFFMSWTLSLDFQNLEFVGSDRR